ncbi:Putative transmembrane anti-sigma factor [Arthrobacter sp. 9AX]|uniref:anti-sigma factor n=1 Tax=Arthrobacter sp. 9AX TaxID=2653131 RepID=UPI0012F38BCC|nr:anti-sigma factor [Arthrobacter sp. 9AX]VXB27049.1 Putative transmembrane anti-sigma factor [Arthrobacter sp. 9AX]
MQHLDPEALSLFALDEPLDAEGTHHLRSCPECTAEVASLRRAVHAARTAPDTGWLEAPGANVWAGIHRSLGLGDAVAADPLGPDSRADTAPEAEAPGPGESGQPAGKPPASVTWLRRPVTWLAAAAAAVLIAAGVVVAVNRTAAPVTLASAQLEPLDRFTATGSATVTESGDGSRTIEVQLNKAEARGYQEVWLIAPDLTRLVSLGIMNSASGRFEVPAGLDLSSYPIVDVSDEPLDGNPAHSSISIVRGTLTS